MCKPFDPRFPLLEINSKAIIRKTHKKGSQLLVKTRGINQILVVILAPLIKELLCDPEQVSTVSEPWFLHA